MPSIEFDLMGEIGKLSSAQSAVIIITKYYIFDKTEVNVLNINIFSKHLGDIQCS